MSEMMEFTVYHLVMRQPPEPEQVDRDPPTGLRLRRVDEAEHAEVATEMYAEVGAAWHWLDRAHWTAADWDVFLAERKAEVWLAEHEGARAGFFVLARRADDEVEILYLGLVPAWIGKGGGAWLLARAIERGWAVKPRHVLLETCSLDAPAALPNYLARGFEVRSEEVVQREVHDGPG